jgi:hypothetical protein
MSKLLYCLLTSKTQIELIFLMLVVAASYLIYGMNPCGALYTGNKVSNNVAYK